jgi:hypothetical protein
MSRALPQPVPGDGRSSNSAPVTAVPGNIRVVMSFVGSVAPRGLEDATRYLNMRRERA